jgi:glutamate-5-semialdehyde dehydrogenase
MDIESTAAAPPKLEHYCREVAKRAKSAAAELALIDGDLKNAWLELAAKQLRARQEDVLHANRADIAAAPDYGLTEAQIDRLRLTPERIEGIAAGLEQVAVLRSTHRPNGLCIEKVRVPLGVVFFIYESRPNVTADAAAICVKAGNAVILRGGKEALQSSLAIAKILSGAAKEAGLPASSVQLVSTTDRAAVGHFLGMPEYIDLAIPRGGEGLIRRVVAEAKMPVLKHFDGNCHVYVDASADLDMAERIVVNSKCQRMGVCNAAESLLVHADIAPAFLPRIDKELAKRGIELRGDQRTRQLAPNAKNATEQDYRTEYLGPVLSVCVVDTLETAIDHINRYGSHHTDAIVTSDSSAGKSFAESVDSAAVMINASTRFNDGGEFGLGAEIGISTDKYHARGPCGLEELTTYKYVVTGSGQVRE